MAREHKGLLLTYFLILSFVAFLRFHYPVWEQVCVCVCVLCVDFLLSSLFSLFSLLFLLSSFFSSLLSPLSASSLSSFLFLYSHPIPGLFQVGWKGMCAICVTVGECLVLIADVMPSSFVFMLGLTIFYTSGPLSYTHTHTHTHTHTLTSFSLTHIHIPSQASSTRHPPSPASPTLA